LTGDIDITKCENIQNLKLHIYIYRYGLILLDAYHIVITHLTRLGGKWKRYNGGVKPPHLNRCLKTLSLAARTTVS